MTAWPTRRLGDVTDVLSGFAFDSQGFNDSDGLPVVRIRDVVRGTTSTYYRGVFGSQYLIDSGDILIGMDGEFNHARWRGGRALLNQRVCRISSSSPDLDGSYLFHFLPAALKAIENVTPYVTVKHLSVKQIRDIVIPFPPLKEQRRIAEILDKADVLRANRRATLAQLDALSQSIFLDMFGDPATNSKAWPEIKFGSVCERVTVGIVVRPASYYRSQGVPALRSLNVKPGKILLNDLVFVSKQDNETMLRKTRLREGDLVLVRSGQPGTAAVVPARLDGVNAIDLLIASPSKDKCDPSFACAFFNSRGGRAIVLASQRGQVQKHLNVGSLIEALIPLPPFELQREYSRRLNASTRQLKLHTEALGQLDFLFGALQQRAFRGEL